MATRKQGVTKQANVLDVNQFARLMHDIARHSEHSLRDQVMVLLSHKAGLRACEIAGLDWDDVCDAEGNVRQDTIFIPGDVAKNGKARTLPVNQHLYAALVALRNARPNDTAIAYATRAGIGRLTANAVAKFFERLYETHGFANCSSHSGRRTFITNAARAAGRCDMSLVDVAALAGHASVQTTQRYVSLSHRAAELVNMI